MANFIPSNTVIRARPTYSLVAAGDTIALVGGKGLFHFAAEVLSNPKHYLRADKGLMAGLQTADAVGYIMAEMDNGAKGAIIVTKAEYAATAAERDRYAAWLAEWKANRAFFDGMNEGGEGYNPYR